MSGLLEKSVLSACLKMIYSRATGLSLDGKIATPLEFSVRKILNWIIHYTGTFTIYDQKEPKILLIMCLVYRNPL